MLVEIRLYPERINKLSRRSLSNDEKLFTSIDHYYAITSLQEEEFMTWVSTNLLLCMMQGTNFNKKAQTSSIRSLRIGNETTI